MKREHYSTTMAPELADQLKLEAIRKHQTVAETLEQILKAYFAAQNH